MKNIFLLFILILICASQTSAAPFENLSNPFTTPILQQNEPASCADFSGYWTGKCETSDHQTHTDNILIVLDSCRYLSLRKSEFLMIGGRRSTSDTTNQQTVTRTEDWDWSNSDKSELMMRGQVEHRRLDSNENGLMLWSGTMSVESGELTIRVTKSGIRPTQTYRWENCTYTKSK